MPLAIILITFIILSVIALYNTLTSKHNRLKNAWSDIDIQLKRRHDLVPNLVETVKGYKNYEASLMENVTKARSNALMSTGLANQAAAENQLSSALANFFVTAEKYPDLKASASFSKLQDELSTLENDIQSARRYYNATVREFNNTLQKFPANLVAPLFHFQAGEFFGADESERKNVAVSL